MYSRIIGSPVIVPFYLSLNCHPYHLTFVQFLGNVVKVKNAVTTRITGGLLLDLYHYKVDFKVSKSISVLDFGHLKFISQRQRTIGHNM